MKPCATRKVRKTPTRLELMNRAYLQAVNHVNWCLVELRAGDTPSSLRARLIDAAQALLAAAQADAGVEGDDDEANEFHEAFNAG